LIHPIGTLFLVCKVPPPTPRILRNITTESMAIDPYGIAILASGSAYAHRTMGIDIGVYHIPPGILVCDREVS